MTVHYVIKSGSEADQRITDYFNRMEKSLKKCNKLAKNLEVAKGDYLRTADGRLCGLKLINTLPDNWKKCKDYYGYGFPRRRKDNKEILQQCDAIEFQSAKGVCKAIFGASSFHFEGLSICTGVGFIEIGERKVIEVSSIEQIKDAIGREGGSYPKGLRKVKGSTVAKWKEQEAA